MTRLGNNFWVVVEQDNEWRAKRINVGVSDLDRVEVVDGLEENEKVLMLPSTHLFETQEMLQSRLTRRFGGVPGMGQSGSSPSGRPPRGGRQ